MVERTKRGDEEQKETDAAITGEPIAEHRDRLTGEEQITNTTRDKGRTPTGDPERRDTKEENKSK